jgi:hypothetical protein
MVVRFVEKFAEIFRNWEIGTPKLEGKRMIMLINPLPKKTVK